MILISNRREDSAYPAAQIYRELTEYFATESVKQKEIQTSEAVPKSYTNSIGMEFVMVPAGKFMMGSKLSPKKLAQKYGGTPDYYEREHPQHNVKIKKSFYIQTTAVTQKQWNEGGYYDYLSNGCV